MMRNCKWKKLIKFQAFPRWFFAALHLFSPKAASRSAAFACEPRKLASSCLSFANFLGVIVLQVIPHANQKMESFFCNLCKAGIGVACRLPYAIRYWLTCSFFVLIVQPRLENQPYPVKPLISHAFYPKKSPSSRSRRAWRPPPLG